MYPIDTVPIREYVLVYHPYFGWYKTKVFISNGEPVFKPWGAEKATDEAHPTLPTHWAPLPPIPPDAEEVARKQLENRRHE